jgi:hypothetical protein
MHLAHPKNAGAKYNVLSVFNFCVIFCLQLPFGFHCPTDCEYLASSVSVKVRPGVPEASDATRLFQ